MRSRWKPWLVIFAFAIFARFVSYFYDRPEAPPPSSRGNRVVLYCSVDEVYARPILRRIEKRTGLKIDAIFDTEATKTAGLASRIMAEKSRPQADVFWSSALLQALRLTEQGLVQPYTSEITRDVPSKYRSPGGIWTSNGVRARVIVYNAKLQGAPPNALDDLLAPRFRGAVGISNPQFGTASDWVAALALRRGTRAGSWRESNGEIVNYIEALKQNGVRVMPGNADVARAVGSGLLLAGVTDTDDYLAAKKRFPDLRLALPGPMFQSNVREEMVSETVFVPMPVLLIADAPHADAGKRLIDALASRDTEEQLIRLMPGVLPVRLELPAQSRELRPYVEALKSAPEDTSKWAKLWEDVRDPLAEVLLKN
jgi:iron(III) transport system substrate-binding protein